MRRDWTFRWWDAVALAAVLAAAVLVVQAGMARPGTGGTRYAAEAVTVLVPRPLPETTEALRPGAVLLDARGHPAGEIRDVAWVPSRAPRPEARPSGDRDLKVVLRVDGELTLARDLPGFGTAPGDLRIGHWLLVRVARTELAGMIIGLDSDVSGVR